MSTNLTGRKIEMFRCHLDPAIGPKPKLAFMVGKDGIMDAEIIPQGVYVTWVNGSPGNSHIASEHLVPYANVQSIRLAEEEKKPAKDK